MYPGYYLHISVCYTTVDNYCIWRWTDINCQLPVFVSYFIKHSFCIWYIWVSSFPSQGCHGIMMWSWKSCQNTLWSTPSLKQVCHVLKLKEKYIFLFSETTEPKILLKHCLVYEVLTICTKVIAMTTFKHLCQMKRYIK